MECKYYDTNLFVEIVESTNGVVFVRQEMRDDVTVRYYDGLGGRSVMIDCSEEDFPYATGRFYLRQLGLQDMIPALFPLEEDISLEEALELPNEKNTFITSGKDEEE